MTTRSLRAVVVVVCLATLAVGVLTPAPAFAATSDEVAAEMRLYAMINGERAARGLAPLRIDVRLVPGARGWTAQMAASGSLAHDPHREGQMPAGTQQSWENVGYTSAGGDPIAQLHGMFMGSGPHRQAILSSTATDAAIGVVFAGNRTWVTERFTAGAPASVHPAVEATVDLARALFPAGAATHAVIVRDDAFPDALAAGPLAAAGGPILLNPPGPAVHPAVRATLSEVLGPGAVVYLLGGGEAVSGQAEEELRAAGFAVERLAGDDRTATAAVVAREIVERYGRPHTVALTSASGWADAVAAGAFGARAVAPVILTEPDTLSPVAAAILGELDPAEVVAIGGSAALSDDVVAAAGARRVAGRTRAETSAEVARTLWGRNTAAAAPQWSAVPGDDPHGWGWAVAIAPLAARLDAAPLLVGTAGVDPEVHHYLGSLGYGNGTAAELVVHGPVPEAAVAELRGLLGQGER